MKRVRRMSERAASAAAGRSALGRRPGRRARARASSSRAPASGSCRPSAAARRSPAGSGCCATAANVSSLTRGSAHDLGGEAAAPRARLAERGIVQAPGLDGGDLLVGTPTSRAIATCWTHSYSASASGGDLDDRELAQLGVELEPPEDRAAEAQERPERRLGVGQHPEDVQRRQRGQRLPDRLGEPDRDRGRAAWPRASLVLGVVNRAAPIGHHARACLRAGHEPRPAPLRAWQRRRCQRMADWTEGTFLLSAAPGAGKTRPALELAREQLATGAVKSVVVACPTAPLTRQWARAASGLGVELAPDCRLAATAPRLPRRRGHLRADRQGAAAVGESAAGVVAGDRRRGPSPRRGAGLGRGVSRRRWARARGGCCCRARRFARTRPRSPAFAMTRAGRRRARPLLHLRRRRSRSGLPAGLLRRLRRDAVLAQRRRRDRVELRDRAERPRGQSPLPDGDLDRAARRAAADPARGRRQARGAAAPTGTATPAAW